MFYLSGRGKLSRHPEANDEDQFGWYLGDGELVEDKIYKKSSRSSRLPGQVNDVDESISTNPTVTIITCNDISDHEPSNYSVSSDLKNEKTSLTAIEHIEMNSFVKHLSSENQDIDLEMIENDANRGVFTSSIKSAGELDDSLSSENKKVDNESRGFCYTPERLVRTQAYRILTPSPRYLSIPRSAVNGIDDTNTRRLRGHRRKIGDLIDAKQFGASHLEALLDSGVPEIRLPLANRRRWNRDRSSYKKNIELNNSPSEFYEPLEIANRESPETFQTPDLVSSRSSYERLNSWEERSKIIRRSSQDDTSGIHSNDWSSDTPSDVQAPVCLCDELASASRRFSFSIESRNRTAAINEVVSILEDLERDPDRAAELLEEDRFLDATSGHDHLTRLALAIEPDGSPPAVHLDPENLVLELRGKVERLQETTRNILKDVDALRRDFECNENKVDGLIDAAVTLRQDTNEMRYLDDLLNLLDGELERISRRNWPFVFGHENQTGEMNLVV
ncbi:uncharacterized protein [Venturia canescens]|uniref:uncharacterized protein n=1 Tax=Venturia canescens TaxID=32260 RepID=UPI001C9C9F3C|nr:uncharacterized protein LOC122408407 [Venturia canescens]